MIALDAVHPKGPASVALREDESPFAFLDRDVARLEADEFLKRQENARLFYRPLRSHISEAIAKHPQVKISYYFEDLQTDAWTGVNERVGYIPASLAKIPTLAAVLKKLEIEDTDGLTTELTIAPEDFDPRSGVVTKEQIGQKMTIGEIAETYLGASDNSAGWALKHLIDHHDLVEARIAMGMPPLDTPGAEVSPKVYGNVMRSLYRSTYLPRPLSHFILSILSESIYLEGLPKGVPEGIVVAHKVGAFADIAAYHDCGIVYHPERHYFICVMTQGSSSLDEANTIIEELSRITYNMVTNDPLPPVSEGGL